jgi:hydroxyacylglutathione hydrolase
LFIDKYDVRITPVKIFALCVEGKVFMILLKLPVGPMECNCYIVADRETLKGMIIDPGYSASEILEQVAKYKVEVEYILLTHGHLDHTCAVSEVKKATGAKLAVHKEDTDMLKDTSLGAYLGINNPPVPEPDVLLKDGDKLSLGKLIFKVIHTPGHTPGGICLLGEGACFSGDTLFKYGIGRADLPGGDGVRLISSIKEKLLTLSPITKVYPGHGPDTTIEAERRGNPYI